jgi:hypothetical protein
VTWSTRARDRPRVQIPPAARYVRLSARLSRTPQGAPAPAATQTPNARPSVRGRQPHSLPCTLHALGTRTTRIHAPPALACIIMCMLTIRMHCASHSTVQYPSTSTGPACCEYHRSIPHFESSTRASDQYVRRSSLLWIVRHLAREPDRGQIAADGVLAEIGASHGSGSSSWILGTSLGT